MTQLNTPTSPVQAHLKRLWLHGFLVGFGVLFALLLVWYFIWGWPISGTPEGPEEVKPTVSAAPPAAVSEAATLPAAPAQPPATLKAELEAVLGKLAEANQRKDLPLLLSLYDPSFPDLSGKTEEISRTWAAFDYRRLKFRIDELKSPAPDRAIARVTWEAETMNRSSHEVKDLTKRYLVEFTKASGRWRLKSLEKTGKAGEQEKSG